MCGRYALEEAGIADAYLVLLRLLGKALQANRRGTSAEPAAVAASRQRRRRRGGGCAGAGARASGFSGQTWWMLPHTSHTSMPSCSWRAPAQH